MLKTQPIPMPKPKTHHLAMALAVAVATQLVATTTAIRVGFGVTTGCSIPFRKMGLALGFLGARCSVLSALCSVLCISGPFALWSLWVLQNECCFCSLSHDHRSIYKLSIHCLVCFVCPCLSGNLISVCNSVAEILHNTKYDTRCWVSIWVIYDFELRHESLRTFNGCTGRKTWDYGVTLNR